MARDVFDEAYYRRFYGRSPVHTRRQVGHLAAAVDELCAWWRVPVRSVLDVGAGPGYWRDWYQANRPAVRYHSVDVSEHACRRYGHQHRDIATWRPARPFDLVVCQGVLHYLDDDRATRAIEHLAAATRHVLYLEAPTAHDLAHVADREISDLDVHARPGSWYADRLDRWFVRVGAGVWAGRSGAVVPYELERA